MNRTRSRTLATILGTTTMAVALLGGATAAHAEMIDPPVQTYVDWEPGIPLGSAGGAGSVPSDLDGFWSLYGMNDNGTYSYGPTQGGDWVTGGMVDHFNDYKGAGNCWATEDNTIDCNN